MGFLRNVERIALDIVEVEAQIIPAIVASALTGGVGGALVAGLSVGTRAILAKIDLNRDGVLLREVAGCLGDRAGKQSAADDGGCH